MGELVRREYEKDVKAGDMKRKVDSKPCLRQQILCLQLKNDTSAPGKGGITGARFIFNLGQS